MPTLTLIDGSGYIFRAYHALPPLSNPAGTPVGAVYGFISMLIKLMDSNTSDAVVVVFDAGRQTFRNRLYAEYKAHRPEAPADLIPQFKLVRDAVDAMSLPRVEAADWEADDLIAAYARTAREAGWNVVIMSSDKDLMQLIADGVSMVDPMKQKTIAEAQVREKFGVGPERVRDVLALIGDASDNVPGVRGIGPKTAADLINQFGDLETLLARAGEITKPKCRETVMASVDHARLSYQLIGLDANAPLPLPLEALALQAPDPVKFGAFLTEQGFHSLLSRVKDKFHLVIPAAPAVIGVAPAPTATEYALVQDMPTLTQWIAEAQEKGEVALAVTTTSTDSMQAEIVGIALATAPGRACYIPLQHITGDSGALFSVPAAGQLKLQDALAQLAPLLADPGVLKIGHTMKYAMLVLARANIPLAPVTDTMLLSYTLEAGLHGNALSELVERHLQHTCLTLDEVTGTGKQRLNFDHVSIAHAQAYAAEEADMVLRLSRILRANVAAEHKLTVYETMERPLISVLMHMEQRGVAVDEAMLDRLSQDFAMRMAVLEQEIHALAGGSFNIGSPKQLGEVLFERLSLPGGKKSGKTGAYGTDSSVLEELAAQGHAMPGKVLEWRQLAKLRSTYTEALKAQINWQTKRVHTTYAMAATTTGRLSSSDPNLQNIPIRTVEGRKIRTAFVAAQGMKLISADYSQIELRLLAHMADIAPLKAAFAAGEDIHAITASQMFGMPVNEVTADLRRSAKTINFGIIYGMSAHGLAVRLGIGRAEAAAYIERYFEQYPGIRAYMEITKTFAREHGYVETLFGRRCHVPGIQTSNGAMRQFAERQAINAPLQGTAADIIKRAMIRWETQANPSATLLLQVHDELIFEAPEATAEAALPQIKRIMEQAALLSVPLKVEIGMGDNWGNAH